MTDYRVDASSSIPLIHQIARQIRARIARGELGAGEALPPVRELGLHLAVNFNTVAKAYRLLEKEGLVTIRRGLGASVGGLSTLPGRAWDDEALLEDIEDLVSRYALSGGDLSRLAGLFARALENQHGKVRSEHNV